jgi:hypothetical protein
MEGHSLVELNPKHPRGGDSIWSSQALEHRSTSIIRQTRLRDDEDVDVVNPDYFRVPACTMIFRTK